jgi:hypothetical protein
MADVSDVRLQDIKDISDSLEALSCKFNMTPSRSLARSALTIF